VKKTKQLFTSFAIGHPVLDFPSLGQKTACSILIADPDTPVFKIN